MPSASLWRAFKTPSNASWGYDGVAHSADNGTKLTDLLFVLERSQLDQSIHVVDCRVSTPTKLRWTMAPRSIASVEKSQRFCWVIQLDRLARSSPSVQ